MTSENMPAVQQAHNRTPVVRSYEDIDRLAKRLAATNFVPSAFRGKADDCFAAIWMGLEVGLNPLQALQSIAVINGKPSIYGDGAIGLVYRSGQLEKLDAPEPMKSTAPAHT